jgi:hypothetical protein
VPVITMHQLRKRTKHDLFSDDEVLCNHTLGPMTVRKAERLTEKRYPTHRHLRLAAQKYFLNQGWDVVTHGVGVWGVKKSMSDMAIAKGKKIVLVECTTQGSVYFKIAQRKRRLERLFPLWFVIEDPTIAGDSCYRGRAGRLAKRSRVFVWSKGNGLTRHSIRR